MESYFKVFALIILSAFSIGQNSQLFASDFASSNLQILHGSNFEVGKSERSIITFEQVNNWTYGNNHLFFDVTNPNEANTNIYGEFSPSLSLGKILDKDLSNQIIKDMRITSTLEMGMDFRANLYGIGFDFNAPYFTFFLLNIYARDTAQASGSTAQVTVAWKLPFKIGSGNFLSTGFADFAAKESQREANQLVAPQILFDIGKIFSKVDSVYAGIEYQYWKNKFGIKDANESVIQGMIKIYLY